MKVCASCKVCKELTEFSKGRCKGGVSSWCKQCHRSSSKRWAEQNQEKLKAYRAATKEMTAASSKKSAQKHRLKRNLAQRARCAADPIKTRAREAKRREPGTLSHAVWLEKKRRYAERNKAKLALKSREYKGLLRQCQVSWACTEKMQKFYDDAKALREATGKGWQVDHIVPLKSDVVCGLHNEFNLRVVTEFENKSKKNKLLPELLAAG